MRAADLRGDAEFLAFLGCWERDYRCPLPFADWLRERGLERQAEVAEWAATADRKMVYGESRVSKPGMYPAVAWSDSDGKHWFWDIASILPFEYSDELPSNMLGYVDKLSPNHLSRGYFDSRHDALVALLDGVADWLAADPARSIQTEVTDAGR